MTLMLCNQGANLELQALVNKLAPQALDLKLFKNDWAPAKGDTEVQATEADFTGYVGIALTGASWAVTTADPAVASYAAQVFTSSADQSAQNIYGYYLVQHTSGKLVYAERFADGPYAVSKNTQKIWVTPQITLT
ncbi:MAG: hypothetical protein ABSD47_01155 [Candidatus Methylomirabilota bacterium]|jgi:hypothetical protein